MRNIIKYYGLLRFSVLIIRYVFSFQSIKVPGVNHKIILRDHSTDKEVFKKIFLKLEYSFRQLTNIEYIVDAGAYTGLSGIYFKTTFPKSRIICIEPSKTNFDMLIKNLEFYPDVTTVNRALWNEVTSLNFLDQEPKQFGSKVVDEPSSVAIASTTINQILEENEIPYIDLLKVDIEGSEKELFEKNYAEWLPKTRYIIIELHDRFKPGSAKSFFGALNTINYSLHLKGENILIINHDFRIPDAIKI